MNDKQVDRRRCGQSESKGQIAPNPCLVPIRHDRPRSLLQLLSFDIMVLPLELEDEIFSIAAWQLLGMMAFKCLSQLVLVDKHRYQRPVCIFQQYPHVR